MAIRKLQTKILFQKYKKIICVFVVCIIIILVFIGIKRIDISWVSENPALFSIIGTCVGALIGGLCTFFGSVWINDRQQKAKENIRKRNIIYNPLYDELINIQDIILNKNPYPKNISFEKDRRSNLLEPQFSAWGRIKNSNRYLEVPDDLRNQMERLEKSIIDYQKEREQVGGIIEEIFNNVLKEYTGKAASNKIFTLGAEDDILQKKDGDIYGDVVSTNDIDEPVKLSINNAVYKKCNQNQTIINTRESYENWKNIQDQTIKLLSLMIEQINIKYEG